VIRTLHSELLDALPAQNASAIQSRRDLRRINNLMGHARIIARSLKKIFPNSPPSHILEIGAGDGQLLLRVARRMNSSRRVECPSLRGGDFAELPNVGTTSSSPPRSGGEGRGEVVFRAQGENQLDVRCSQDTSFFKAPVTDVLFIDLQNLLRDETKAEFAALNWRVRAVESDIFDWLSKPSAKTDVVLANLVLHHFTDAQLTLLFSQVAEKSDALIAVEPRRARWPLFFARLLALIGCNAVTCHDAPISVRAGFTGRELSALWPRNGEWELTECRAGLFSHLFVARRKGEQ
jgi:SAM-dependent methyltransferase